MTHELYRWIERIKAAEREYLVMRLAADRLHEREVEVTREKLRSLEARYHVVSQDPGEDAHIQELTLRSLKRIINQTKEEIARFESRRSSRAARFPATISKA